jgi:hypothetical protein
MVSVVVVVVDEGLDPSLRTLLNEAILEQDKILQRPMPTFDHSRGTKTATLSLEWSA